MKHLIGPTALLVLSLGCAAEAQEAQGLVRHSDAVLSDNGNVAIKSAEIEKFSLDNANAPKEPRRTMLLSGTELIQNGGFESGPSPDSYNFSAVGSPWSWAHTGSASTSDPRYYSYSSSHTGSWSIYFDWGAGVNDQLAQQITIPANSTATLSFWLKVRANSLYTSSESDVFGVNFCDLAGNPLNGFVKNYHLSSGTGSYSYYSYDVSMFAGQTVYLLFWNQMVASTVFLLDDVSLVVNTSSSACTEDAWTMCLGSGRYKVTSSWQNQYSHDTVRTPLQKTTFTDVVGTFWMNAGAYQYFISVNPATSGLNGYTWVAINTFSGVEFWIDVTDTVTGLHKTYHNPPENKTLVEDRWFFPYP
jgi:hypothetical protein